MTSTHTFPPLGTPTLIPVRDCTVDTCQVSRTILGYQPALAPNIAGAVIFGICFVAQLLFGLRFRTWSYLIAMGFGVGAETIGYIGRLMLHNNPFSTAGLEIEIVCLTFAPAFLAAGIYLNLKHVVMAFGPEFSRLKPQMYTWIFICCDIVSIFVQSGGAGYSASTSANETVATDIILFGLSSQVVTLIIFGLLSAEFFFRERRQIPFVSTDGNDKGWRQAAQQSSYAAPAKTRAFKLFVAALVLAYVTISIRCVYRIAEMSQGWKGPVMQNESLFVGLDEVMIIIAVVALTVFHPGYCLPKKTQQRIGDEIQLQGRASA